MVKVVEKSLMATSIPIRRMKWFHKPKASILWNDVHFTPRFQLSRINTQNHFSSSLYVLKLLPNSHFNPFMFETNLHFLVISVLFSPLYKSYCKLKFLSDYRWRHLILWHIFNFSWLSEYLGSSWKRFNTHENWNVLASRKQSRRFPGQILRGAL
jgi:hypothetical protein